MTLTLPQVKSPTAPGATDIEWADFSWNPLRAIDPETGKTGWACVKVSAGCKHCYAEHWNATMKRGTGLPFDAASMKRVKVVLDEQRLERALAWKPRMPAGGWKGGRSRPTVFVADMTDMFGEWVSFETLDRLFALFALRPDVDWLLLTKRPERMAEYLATHRIDPMDFAKVMGLAPKGMLLPEAPWNPISGGQWTLPNVWLGCSAEDQKAADERIQHLLACPAAVRFVSYEPALGPVDFRDHFGRWLCEYCGASYAEYVNGCPKCHFGEAGTSTSVRLSKLHWLIVGGESGPKARPCNVEWLRAAVAQCKAAGVKVFVKQLGSRILVRNDRFDDWPCGGDQLLHSDEGGTRYQGELINCRLRDNKGGDMAEWPPDLRVREFPEARA